MAVVGSMAPLAIPLIALLATAASRRAGVVLRLGWWAGWGLWVLGAVVLAWAHGEGDAFSRWYTLLVLAVGGLSLLVSVHYVGSEWRQGDIDGAMVRRYFLYYHAFILALVGVGVMQNYLLIWAAVEATTYASVPLVALSAEPEAVEAGWKYLVITGTGGLLALLGTVLLLHGAGQSLSHWGLLGGASRPVLAPDGAIAVRVGLILALVGYGSKAGLVPFHTWLPDAHSQAPAPVSALLSGVKLAAGMVALIRLTALGAAAIGPLWPHTLLLITGVLSLALAAAAVTGQRDMKRLFAYSSIEHMGVIALGAGFGGIGLLGALLHMWTHAFGKSALFYGAGNVRLRYGATGAPQVRGVLAVMPLTGSAVALAAAAIVGLPPFGLFWSEWLVLWGGLQTGHGVWVAVALALLLVNLLGFGLRLPDLLLGSPPDDLPSPRGGAASGGVRGERWAAVLPLGVAVAAALVVGLALPAGLHATWFGAAHLLELHRAPVPLPGGGAR